MTIFFKVKIAGLSVGQGSILPSKRHRTNGFCVIEIYKHIYNCTPKPTRGIQRKMTLKKEAKPLIRLLIMLL